MSIFQHEEVPFEVLWLMVLIYLPVPFAITDANQIPLLFLSYAGLPYFSAIENWRKLIEVTKSKLKEPAVERQLATETFTPEHGQQPPNSDTITPRPHQ